MSLPSANERVPLLAFLNNFMIGGTEQHVVRLSQALDPSRFELHLACLSRRGDLLGELGPAPASLSEYSIRRLYGVRTLRRQRDFARQLKRCGIRIAHTYGFYPNVFGVPAARAAGVSVVIASIRDQGDHLSPLQRRVQKLACRFADAVLANSEAVKRRLVLQGWRPDRIGVVPNGVELTSFPPGVAAATRRELGLPARAPVVAVCSRLAPIKGIEYFLEAAVAVGRLVPETHFLVVGDEGAGPPGYRKRLEERARSLGLGACIRFTGMRRDVSRLLSVVSVFVQPSLSEGLSNALLEAMAAGVPVVATEAGGNSEAVEDGISGLLVAPRDAGGLAGAVIRLLGDGSLAARVAAAGRERVERRFSLRAMVGATEALYLRLLQSADRERQRACRCVYAPAGVEEDPARGAGGLS